MLITALDTETTGLDIPHGCRPFYVSTLSSDGVSQSWQWAVDPHTRVPKIPLSDVHTIQQVIDTSTKLVFHNSKFDLHALASIGISVPHSKVEDTHLASHVLESKNTHALKPLALLYLDIEDDDQEELRVAVQKARRIGDKQGWRIAREYDPHWPGIQKPPKGKDGDDSWWFWDMWLPKAVSDAGLGPPEWASLCARYCNQDALRTLGLYYFYLDDEGALAQESLLPQYHARLELSRVVYKMENTGITINSDRMETMISRFSSEVAGHEGTLKKLSKGKLVNPNASQQLASVLFNDFKLKGVTPTETGWSTAAADLIEIRHSLQDHLPAAQFIDHITGYRKKKKALEYLDTYSRLAFPITGTKHYKRLLANFNEAGTDTTRMASYNPNAQNISKQEGFNLRHIFGPLPEEVWYSFDYSNVELRIFAYASEDQDLIRAFETGYSVHLLVAELLYPKEFARCTSEGLSFKKEYESTLYQWIKNGNFSLIYGASEKKADATYRKIGAYRAIRKRFKNLDKFMESKFDEARSQGYITTLGGYRLQVPTSEPHKAVNYFVQGTAGWAMAHAMVRVNTYIEGKTTTVRLLMNIHDELVFATKNGPVESHRPFLRGIKRCMESVKDVIGLPVPVECDHITTSWDSEEKVNLESNS